MTDKAITRRSETRGKFSQIPIVLLDTCDLPENYQMLFIRLWRETYNGTNAWQGSIRKLASIAHVSIGTAYAASKRLEQAGLFEVETLQNPYNNADSLIIRIKSKELWPINEYYCHGGKVELWKQLPSIEGAQNGGCSKSEQGCSENDTGGVQNLNGGCSNSEQGCSKSEHQQARPCSKSEQGVFNSQAQNTPLDRDIDRDILTIDKEIDSRANAPVSHTTEHLSEKEKKVQTEPLPRQQQKWFEEIYCGSKVALIPPEANKTLKKHVSLLSRHIMTLEELNSLYDHCRPKLRGKNPTVYAGNLIHCLTGWLQERQESTPPEEVPKAVPELKDDDQILWTINPDYPGRAVEDWRNFRMMTVREAREKYQYGQVTLNWHRVDQHDIRARLFNEGIKLLFLIDKNPQHFLPKNLLSFLPKKEASVFPT
jgi:hypothetical protein